MDYRTGHLVNDIKLVPEEKRKQYEELNAKQVELAKKLLDGADEAHLTRQQIRHMRRLIDKREKK